MTEKDDYIKKLEEANAALEQEKRRYSNYSNMEYCLKVALADLRDEIYQNLLDKPKRNEKADRKLKNRIDQLILDSHDYKRLGIEKVIEFGDNEELVKLFLKRLREDTI
jgi:hypothetical protein